MPIPFIIGGAVLALAGVGVKKGFDAKSNFDQANSVVELAEIQLGEAKEKLEDHRQKTQSDLEELGKQKLTVEAQSIKRFLTLLKKVKSANYNELNLGDMHINISNDELKEMEMASIKALELTQMGFGGIATGVLAGIGASGMATTLGVASTGTAISSLAGAAATNATLAWLGGGSLAAGGFGIAGGMAVLGGLVAGPALAVIGLAAAAKSEQALTKAYQRSADVDVVIEQISNGMALLNTLRQRIAEVSDAISAIDRRLQPAMDAMDAVLSKRTGFFRRKNQDYTRFSEEDKATFETMLLLGMSLNKLLKVNLLCEDGSLDPESKIVIDQAQCTLG